MEGLIEFLEDKPTIAAVVLSAAATITTIVLAFAGFLVNHMSSVQSRRLEARLRFVSAQLERLYGPLYTLVQSNTASYRVFRQTFRPDAPLYDRTKPFSDEERAIWRTWAENVFVPSNLKIQAVIEQNAHLVDGGEMPAEFEQMVAHVESSKLVLPSLNGDLSMLDRFAPWPSGFNDFVAESYAQIVREHGRLLGRARKRKAPAARSGGAA